MKRFAALVAVALLVLGVSALPALLIAQVAASQPATASTVPPKTADQVTAERFRDLATAAVIAIGASGTVVVAMVKTWRSVKSAIEDSRKEHAEAAKTVAEQASRAAEKVAQVAATTAQQVATVAAQVTLDADSTLRNLVQQQGEQIKRHTDEFAEFKAEILESMAQSQYSLNSKIGGMQEMLNRILAKMANL